MKGPQKDLLVPVIPAGFWITQAPQQDPEFGNCIFKCQKDLDMNVQMAV